MISDSQPRVLLVDDEPANLLALEALLEPLGARLVRAGSGEQALKKASESDFAAILLDLRMPGMDGMEAAALIRQQGRSRNTPIIFITASDSSDIDIDAAYGLGAVDFLTKPVRSAVLKAKVSFFIESHRQQHKLREAQEAAQKAMAAEANAKFRAFFEQGSNFAGLMKVDGTLIEANRLSLEACGFTREEVIGRKFWDCGWWSPSPEISAMVREGAREAARGQAFRRETDYFVADGSRRMVDLIIAPVTDTDGRVLFLAPSGTDITERKRAEQTLRESEQRYRTLFESIDEGFCVIEMIYDAQGRPVDYRFLEANPAFVAQTGFVDGVGKTIRELVPDHDAHWFEIYGEVARTGEPMRFVNEARAMGRWYDVYATRVDGPGSKKVALVFSDISERMDAEHKLRKLATELAESDRRKTEFLATLAHELRNPLAPLRNGLHLMRMGNAAPQVLQRTREMMDRQVAHMVHLIDDLLDVARISSGKIELKKDRVALGAVVTSALETTQPLFDAAHHSLEVVLPPEPLWLDADPTRLSQVLGNLLNNAAKYTPPGGRISLRAQREGHQVAVTVQDDGIGIPPESLGQLFEMFAQVPHGSDRAQGGLGIGLSLVRALVELHGGSVSASSPGLGMGSTFTVCLPLAKAEPAQAPKGPADAQGAAAGLRVLVVDDNADAAESLASILEMSGHEARVANDGRAALQVSREFVPEVVFLDLGMPGPDGYEVARAMRKQDGMGRAMLVALTGWGAATDRARTREAGFDHHLTKPAELSAVMRLLDQGATARAAAGLSS